MICTEHGRRYCSSAACTAERAVRRDDHTQPVPVAEAPELTFTDALLATTGPLALTVDVALYADHAVPPVDGEDDAAYTDRLLASSRADRPGRRRECSMGYHASCSDATGDGGCECDCHLILRRLYADHPFLSRWWGAVDCRSMYSAWETASRLVAAGYTLTLDDAPTTFLADDAEVERYAAVYWPGVDHEDEFITAVRLDAARRTLKVAAKTGLRITPPQVACETSGGVW